MYCILNATLKYLTIYTHALILLFFGRDSQAGPSFIFHRHIHYGTSLGTWIEQVYLYDIIRVSVI